MEERVAILEVEVRHLQISVDNMNSKLDSLLQLRSKGMGAFWLASMLVGSGIVGAILHLVDWFKGVH